MICISDVAVLCISVTYLKYYVYQWYNILDISNIGLGLFSYCAKRAETHFWAEAPEIIPQF